MPPEDHCCKEPIGGSSRTGKRDRVSSVDVQCRKLAAKGTISTDTKIHKANGKRAIANSMNLLNKLEINLNGKSSHGKKK